MIIKKVTILIKYLNFVDVFLKKVAVELFKRFDINEHLIDLELGQLFYSIFKFLAKAPFFIISKA